MNDYARAPNQPLLTTSSPTFAGLTINGAATFAATVTVTTSLGTSGSRVPVVYLGGNAPAASAPFLDASQTWNDVNVAFVGAKVNVTNTNSAYNAKLLDLQVGGSSKFSIIKDGGLEFLGSGAEIGIFPYSGSLGFFSGYTGGVRNAGMFWNFDGAVCVLSGHGTNRFSIESDAALNLISENSVFEFEGANDGNPLTITGYILGSAVSKTINISNAGTTTPAVPFRVTAGDNSVNIQEWYQGSSRQASIGKSGEITSGNSAIAGTDTNTAGANATLRSGLGTGTGTVSKILLVTPTVVASGTGAQTYDACFVALGGLTSSFPAIDRNGNAMRVILADGSNFATLQAGDFFSNGTKVIGAQGAAVADASGGATVDAEARTAINTLLARCRAHGLVAT